MMKDKILFWISDGLIHFGIAKYFQEKFDSIMFSIIDCNHITKNFFSNQTLVKFQKVWFFSDFISDKRKDPDIEYLKTIEEKYNLNLWHIAYSDRAFYKFNDFYKFSYDEILYIMEQECRLYENILQETNPSYLLIESTDYHKHTLLCEICKAKNISVMMLCPGRFGYRVTISSDFDVLDDITELNNDSKKSQRTFDEAQEYLNKYNTYQQYSKPFTNPQKSGFFKVLIANLRFLLFICNNTYRKHYLNWGKTRWRYMIKSSPVRFLLKRWDRQSFLNRYSIRNIDTSKPFVYFPLHVEPEKALSFTAPFYTNQLEVIRHIAKALPVGYYLYVKEHYGMRRKPWREKSVYKKILDLPNVKLVHPYVKSELLLRTCSLVTAIAGTSAMEAAFYKKNSIVFADSSYSYLPFIYRIKNVEELPKAIRTMLHKKSDFSSLGGFVDMYDKHSFEFDVHELRKKISEKFYLYNGMSKEVEIPQSKMKNFLEEQKSDFEKLVDEHIKRIENHKKIKTQNVNKSIKTN